MWTAKRVAEVSARTFGGRSPPEHVSRRLKHGGWSQPPPVERATQREEEEAIGQGVEPRGPALNTGRRQADGRPIVWGDEAGCSRLPLAVRPGAPGGQTPVRRVKLPHDPLSAMSGSTPEGRLFRQGRQDR